MQNVSMLSKKELKEFTNHLFRKNLYKYIILSVLTVFLGVFIIWVNTSTLNLIAGIMLAVLGAGFVPIILLINKLSLKKVVENNERKYGENGIIVLTELLDNGLVFKSQLEEEEISSTALAYQNIYNIEENEEYIFIYLDKTQALCLNKKGFINCTYKEFKDFLMNKIQDIIKKEV